MRKRELSSPVSVALKFFNSRTGANCKTMEETAEYLKQHPEARRRLTHGPRTEPDPSASPEGEERQQQKE